MKKIAVFTVMIILMAFVTAVQAEVKAGSFSVTPFVGYFVFEGNQDLKTSATYGLRTGYNVTKNLGVEGFFSYSQTEFEDTIPQPWQDLGYYGIEGLYHFMPEGRVVPFIAIGLGGMSYSRGYYYTVASYGDRFIHNDFTLDYGAGLKFSLTDNIALRADVRHVLPLRRTVFDPDLAHNDFLATLGVTFSFGGKEKIVHTQIEEPVTTVVPEPVPEPAPAPTPTPTPTPAPAPAPAPALALAPPPPPHPVMEENLEALSPPPPPPVQQKVTIALNVEFDTGKAVVKEKYHYKIKKVADFLKKHPETKALIKGHTDNVGKEAFNQNLSEKRANSVRQYIINKFGIDGSRLTAIGYDANEPIASNRTKEGRRKNRRVDAVIESIEIK